MPVILWIPPDPTDLVIQGEQMRLSAMGGDVASMQSGPLRAQYAAARAAGLSPLLLDDVENNLLVAGQINFPPTHPAFTPYHARLRDAFALTMIAANAVVATPCGALFPVNMGASGILINNFIQDTTLWKLQGVTRDNVGAPLGNCEVVAFETGQLFVGGAPVEGRTVSDGSGNYTIPVARMTHYEVIAYLAGSPDRAGITLRTLTPVAT